jgi:hypothetical protein
MEEKSASGENNFQTRVPLESEGKAHVELDEEKKFFDFQFLQRVFHRYRQATFAYGGSILSSSQFLLLPHLSQKMKIATKVVIMDSKIMISQPVI